MLTPLPLCRPHELGVAVALGVAAGLLVALLVDAPASGMANFVQGTRAISKPAPTFRFALRGARPVAAVRPQHPTRRVATLDPPEAPEPSMGGPLLSFVGGCVAAVVGLLGWTRGQVRRAPQLMDLPPPAAVRMTAISGIQDLTQAPDVIGPDAAPGSIYRRMEAMLRRGQDKICAAVEACDGLGTFRADAWSLPNGAGGGVSRVLAGGRVWEKAGCNLSVLRGKMPQSALSAATEKAPEYLKRLGLREGEPVPFFVASLSCVMHPRNPHCPTMHFNYRYFELDQNNWWFAGGTDITPAYIVEDDMRHFHGTYKKICDKYDSSFYPTFKKWADKYFLIPHRGETRGLGGIFFDDLNGRDPETLFQFQEECLMAVAEAYVPIVAKHQDDPFTEEQKRWQQIRRGRYAEFNFIYDRGTIFGLRAGGRIESILMSIPETARWEYNHRPTPGTEEDRLLQACRSPLDWV